MILSGQTIARYAAAGMLIEPFFERTEIEYSFMKMTFGVGPAGYDVRVEFDAEGRVGSKVIEPGGFLLASTIERFKMPIDVLGMVCDKSSWARRGLAVQHTVIEPGWEGWLTLELTNHSSDQIHILCGMPIAQVVFHRVDESVDFAYDGKYQNQGRGPREAR